MNAYLAVMRLRLILLFQYRIAAAAGVFTQLFFGLVKVMVASAFFQSTHAPMPLTFKQTITYIWLVQAFLGFLPWNGDLELIGMIRTGNIAYELCRPVDLYNLWTGRMLAQRLAPTMMRAVPIFIVAGLLLPDSLGLGLPVSASAALAWAAAMCGALFLSAVLCNLYTIASMWTIADYGVTNIMWAVIMLFSGSLVPLAFFPDWLQPFLRWLPFAAAVDAPLRFYIGAYAPAEILYILPLQIFWTLALAIYGRRLLAIAMKHVAIQGG